MEVNAAGQDGLLCQNSLRAGSDTTTTAFAHDGIDLDGVPQSQEGFKLAYRGACSARCTARVVLPVPPLPLATETVITELSYSWFFASPVSVSAKALLTMASSRSSSSWRRLSALRVNMVLSSFPP